MLPNSSRIASKVVKPPPSNPQKQKQSGDKFEKFQHLKNDSEFMSFMKEMVKNTMTSNEREPEPGMSRANVRPKQQTKRDSRGMAVDNVAIVSKQPQQLMFKSPSDTTIYSPGLLKLSQEGPMPLQARVSPGMNLNLNPSLKTSHDLSIIDKISNFVESIRLDSCRPRNSPLRRKGVELVSSTGRKSHADDIRVVQQEKAIPTSPEQEDFQLLVQAE